MDGSTPARSVRIGKLRAGDQLALLRVAESLPKDEQTGKVTDPAAGFAFAIDLLSRAILDEDGRRSFDCDEAREWLQTQVSACQELSRHAIAFCGFGADPNSPDADADDAKKN